MLSRTFCIGSLVVFAGCAGTSTGNPAVQESEVRRLDESSFLVLHVEGKDCARDGSSDPSKLQPGRAELEARLGDGSAEFIVLLEQEVDLNAYPLPADRSASGEEPLFLARADKIAESQACALEALGEEGGTYVHSLLLINAFIAEMTVEQAIAVSERHDVRVVELAQTDEAPPGL